MRPPDSFISQPIRSLQTMLRVLAENDDRYVPIIPDGIYGPETVRAVSTFQRYHGLPITGVTDQATWEAVVASLVGIIAFRESLTIPGIFGMVLVILATWILNKKPTVK